MDQDKTTTESDQPKGSSTAGTHSDGSFTPEQFFNYSQEIVKKAAEEWKKVAEEYGKENQGIRDDLEKLKKDNDKNKDEIVKQGSRNIEIIGIFSAVLALLIIDVNIVKAAPNFLAAILLIVGLTASLLIFASLIHSLFAHDTKKQSVNTKCFWTGVALLGILIVVGILFHIFGWDLYNSETLSTPKQETPIESPQED